MVPRYCAVLTFAWTHGAMSSVDLWYILQYTAIYCNVLQYAAICNMSSVDLWDTLEYTALYSGIHSIDMSSVDLWRIGGIGSIGSIGGIGRGGKYVQYTTTIPYYQHTVRELGCGEERDLPYECRSLAATSQVTCQTHTGLGPLWILPTLSKPQLG